MIGLLGRQGSAAILRQHCLQMIQRPSMVSSPLFVIIEPHNVFFDENSPLCGSSKWSRKTLGSAFIALGGVKVIDLAEWIRTAHGCTVNRF